MVEPVIELIQFLQQVFNAKLLDSISYREDGSVEHAEMKVGDSVIMMGEPIDEVGAMPASLYLYVENCDATYQKALEMGATSVLAPDDYPHGDRYGGVKDSTGNIWWIVTHLGNYPHKDS